MRKDITIVMKVIHTDKFINMPLSSRLLFYYLATYSDDENIVTSPERIILLAGCDPDDLRVLISNKYVIPCEGGLKVTAN